MLCVVIGKQSYDAQSVESERSQTDGSARRM